MWVSQVTVWHLVGLSADLAAIENWAKRWLVTFNSGKTGSLIISSHQDLTAFRSAPTLWTRTASLLSVLHPAPTPTIFGEQLCVWDHLW